MLGVCSHEPESDSRAMMRRSLLNQAGNGRSDMSIGLEEMSRMTSEKSLGDAGQGEGTRRHLRRSPNGPSDLSLGLDDLGMLSCMSSAESLCGGRAAGFSLDCWDRQNGIRGCDQFNFTNPDQESISDEEGGEADDFGSDFEDEDYVIPLAKSPDMSAFEDKPWHFPDRNVKKVRFDSCPETHTIDRVEPEEYPLVFYCVHELQKMADEYEKEEQQERGNYLARLRLND